MSYKKFAVHSIYIWCQICNSKANLPPMYMFFQIYYPNKTTTEPLKTHKDAVLYPNI